MIVMINRRLWSRGGWGVGGGGAGFEREWGRGVSQGQTDSLKITGALEDANEVMRR